MAKNETKRINPKVLSRDRDSYAAWQALTDYKPVNPAYAADLVTHKAKALEAARAAEAQARAALDAARDAACAAEWEFHNTVLGVKDQVVAQYGPSSDQAQALGRKKKSEYKPRGPRKPKSESE